MPASRPPLTVEQLHEIGQRRKGDADVKALLCLRGFHFFCGAVFDVIFITKTGGVND